MNILKHLNNTKNLLYSKLVKINDTPQRVALGMGVGVFCGIIPGMGPIASLSLAFLLRINRAAALVGSLATNTWLSFVTFLLSIKIGAGIMGLSWQNVRADWQQYIRNLRPAALFDAPALKVILPVLVGYFVISLCLGILAYITTLAILKRKLNKERAK